MIRGILFDLDGTLIDSMDYHFMAWEKALITHDISISKEIYFPMEGMNINSISINLLKIKYKNSEINDSLVESVVQKKNNYISEFRKQIKLYPYVSEILSQLVNKEVKIALVTASHSDQLKNLLDGVTLKKFNYIVTGDKVKKGKPNPESYILGLAGLNLKPYECIAVENAPLGIISAKSAGLYCVGICSTMDSMHLVGADKIIHNFSDLKNLSIIKNYFIK